MLCGIPPVKKRRFENEHHGVEEVRREQLKSTSRIGVRSSMGSIERLLRGRGLPAPRDRSQVATRNRESVTVPSLESRYAQHPGRDVVLDRQVADRPRPFLSAECHHAGGAAALRHVAVSDHGDRQQLLRHPDRGERASVGRAHAAGSYSTSRRISSSHGIRRRSQVSARSCAQRSGRSARRMSIKRTCPRRARSSSGGSSARC
jgi:hypothetical protein